MNLVDQAPYRVLVALQRSMDAAMLGFMPLKSNILWIALGALGASLIGALLLARTISRPVQQLAAVAERIGQGDYEVAIDSSRRDELGQLARAVQHMQQGIAVREKQLAHNALHDPMTGLPNRTLALERLGSAITAARPMALLYLGIDNFRAVTEGLPPGESEEVLRLLGQRLMPILQPGDSLARLVADEFLLLIDRCDHESAVARADEMLQILSEPMMLNGQEVSLECRMGIAAYPADGQTQEELLRRAGIAMRDAIQQAGRLMIYEQGRDAAHGRQVMLIRDLRHAAERNELLLHYQPKMNLSDRNAARSEALLRWKHPDLGMISPGEFIPLAERTGSIVKLTAWVMEEALRQMAEWSTRGLSVEVSLNISNQDLLDLNIVKQVGKLLDSYAVPADRLVFEITESGLMQDPELGRKILEGLRDYGIHLSVDDFGTGYSSLAQLKRMPVQELKIDQSFIRELDETSGDAVIVRSTIEMSHSLGLKVVAEGVEYEQSLKLLESWGCDVVQGYFISRPLPAADFERWLEKSTVQPAVELQS